MKELLTRHWLAKLLSLLLAIGIWFLVNKTASESYSSPKGRIYTISQ